MQPNVRTCRPCTGRIWCFARPPQAYLAHAASFEDVQRLLLLVTGQVGWHLASTPLGDGVKQRCLHTLLESALLQVLEQLLLHDSAALSANLLFGSKHGLAAAARLVGQTVALAYEA